VAGFIVLSLTTAAIHYISWFLYRSLLIFTVIILTILFDVVVPVAVLVINMIVLCEVRRASKHSAANLGLQQHHQSTSSNSAIPTIMLITTSFIYAFLCGTHGIMFTVYLWSSEVVRNITLYMHVQRVVAALANLVYAYNFYVYFITGKQFRSELYKLFRYCSISSSAAPAAALGDDGNDARIARRARNETPV